MVQHILDEGKCRGCGKCVEICSLELWELEDTPDGKKIAMVIEEAGEICHTCMVCRDVCPEEAITVIREDE